MTVYTQSAPAPIFPLGKPTELKQKPCEQMRCARTLKLHAAVQRGCHAEVADLIAGGANLDSQDLGGETPLHLAVRQGDTAMAALLLMSGADALLETPDGVAPRTIARQSGGGLLLRLIETALRQQTISDIYGLTTSESMGAGQSNHSQKEVIR